MTATNILLVILIIITYLGFGFTITISADKNNNFTFKTKHKMAGIILWFPMIIVFIFTGRKNENEGNA
jgi:hypothetical protein